MKKDPINLYKCLPKDFQNRISWNACLKMFFSLLIVLVMGLSYVNFRNYYSERGLKNAIEAKNEKRQAINVLRKKYPKIAKSVALQTKLNEINDTLELHVDLKQQIESHKFSNDEGFSKYFEGLSRNTMDDLWLTEIKIQKGGTYIVLKGLTNNVSSVQNLIKRLESDEAFSDKTIKLKKIETSTLSSGSDEFSLELFSKINTDNTELTKSNVAEQNASI